MKKILAIFLTLILTFSLVSCVNDVKSHDIYVTVYPLEYVTEQILEDTNLTVGIVPGVTSHESSIDWSPKEIIAMTEATYLFYVGANYDQYIDFQISTFKNKNVEMVKIEDEINYIKFIPGEINYTDINGTNHTQEINIGLDPHFWISPLKMIQVSHLIFDKLILKYPDKEALMTSNFNTLINNLQTLSNSYELVLSHQTKLIMTSTNIYGYLREDYGLNYIPISPGYHEENEQGTTQEKETIVNIALSNDISYIFYEKNTSSPLSNSIYTILQEKGVNPTKLEFDILQSLTDEEINQENKNYITEMYKNLDLIKLATDYITE